MTREAADERGETGTSGLEPPPRGSLSPPMPLADLAATRAAGALLAGLLRGGEALLLEGPLGAGKTSLAQGLAAALGVAGAVTSPTFALCHRLPGRLELHHYDLYRVEGLDQLRRIGFEESLESGAVTLVEWPGLCLPLLRGEALVARLDHDGEARRLSWGWLDGAARAELAWRRPGDGPADRP